MCPVRSVTYVSGRSRLMKHFCVVVCSCRRVGFAADGPRGRDVVGIAVREPNALVAGEVEPV